MGLVVDKAPATKVPLRPYQVNIHAQVIEAWEKDPSLKIVMQLPTGGGKTEIAIAEIERRIAMGQTDIIFLVHREDLVNQTIARLKGYGFECSAGSGSFSRWKTHQECPKGIVVMCVQTLVRRLNKQPDAIKGKFVIADEVHWYNDGSSWGLAIDAHDQPVLGMSATIWRMGLEEKFAPTWQALICGPQTDELVQGGWLADNLLIDVPLHVRGQTFSRAADRIRSQDGYNHHATWEAEKSRGTLTKEAVGIWYAWAKERQTICFALTVDHAYALESWFNKLGKAGVPGLEEFKESPVAEVIVGETLSADRRAVISNFAQKKVRVLITVDVLREGFDAPEASCLLVLRHTESVAFWRQMAGRVLRPKEDGGQALILDLVQNHKKLGFPDDRYDWSLNPRIDEMEPGEAPTKVCCEVAREGNCRAVNPLPQHNCMYCELPFGKECPGEPDGCGKWRAWNKWSNMFEKYRPGACDPCKDKSRTLALLVEREAAKAEKEARQKQMQEEWEAKRKADQIAREKERQSKIRELQERADAANNARIEKWGKAVPAWPWSESKNHNGQIVRFALCRAWAGFKRPDYGRGATKIAWALLPNDETPQDIVTRLGHVNDLLDSSKASTKIVQSFETIDDAKLALEHLVSSFAPENRRMLCGDLCSGCKDRYVQPDGQGLPQKCGRCRVIETATTQYGDHGLDIAF